MKHSFFLLAGLLILFSKLQAQDLSVPPEILSELKTATIQNPLEDGGEFTVKYFIPEGLNSDESHPVLLGLSGGNQSENVVKYCYAAWFRSALFSNYITVIPISNKGENMRDYTAAQINVLLASIQAHFSATENNWVVAGTSNGGVASFNFLAASPQRFQGAVVVPGMMRESIEPSAKWNHLTILLAYGDQDTKDWIEASAQTEARLKGYVKSVQTMALKDQGHYIPIHFDMDSVYRIFFQALK